MKLLNKKIINTKTQKQISRAKESQFGKIVAIDNANHVAIVRIQGTQKDIRIPWSRNFYTKPKFVRINNSVEIKHVKGNPHRFEIVGNGTKLNTPVDGSSLLADLPSSSNTIISGMVVTSEGGMTVKVDYGSYRVGGTIYNLSGIFLGNGAMPVMGEDTPLMGQAGGLIELNAAPNAPNYRMDILSVGSDGVIDYTAGVEAENYPVIPTVEANHVLITTILVPYGITGITNALIGVTWREVYLAQFILTVPELDSDWTTITNPPDTLPTSEKQVVCTVSLLNQYGNPLFGTYAVSVEIEQGNGILNPASDNSTSITFNITNGSKTFVYERGGIDGLAVLGTPLDSSPMFKATLLSNTNNIVYSYLLLHDSAEEPMP
jgi:hypothetical protein